MKQFKEFRSEQNHVNEIGPIGATIAGAMGLLGLGVGGYKLYKKSKDKIKGYKETRKERKENPKGKEIIVPVFDKETGEMGSKEVKLPKNMTNSEVKDFVKKFKDKADDQADIAKITVKKEPEKETEPEDKEKELRRKGDAGEIDNDGDANAYYKIVGKAPTGWETKKSKTGKSFTLVKKDDAKPQGKVTGKDTSAADKLLRRNSRVLKFGEFIAEDIMKDLKKISKSKKDSEISLDDGSDIPIDPLTSEILVKYIEGLSSSEKNRTIKQIQRTERAFMKVLGKAHEG